MQVLLLVRATPADGAAAYTDGDVLRDIVVACRADAGVGFRIDPGRVHAQVDRLPVEGFLAGLGVQRAQQPPGLRHRRLLRSGDAEHVAAVGDLHAQAQPDLPPGRVERAGEVGQALDVGRFEGEVAMGVEGRRVGTGGGSWSCY